jgi:hypothetical protein
MLKADLTYTQFSLPYSYATNVKIRFQERSWRAACSCVETAPFTSMVLYDKSEMYTATRPWDTSLILEMHATGLMKTHKDP